MDDDETRVGFAGGQNYGAQIGTSHGVINNNVYLHHNTSSPRPAPSNTVPFRRDPDFVERDVLQHIFDRAAAPAARVALVGLGGIGKSQLAIEYAHRISEAQPSTWVFWVHASTPERFKDSYRKIAEKVQLPNLDNSSDHILNKVYLWLSDIRNGNWLMIVDNADNEQVLFQSNIRAMGPQQQSSHGTPSLSEYLPQSSNGSVLVTTRSRQVAFKITGRDQDILPVKPMDSDVSVALLQKKLRDSSDYEGMLHLGEQVGYMPLALTQAAAYINQRSPQVNLRSYVERLRRGNQDQLRLLQTDLGDPRRDGATSNSIILTLQISLDHINQVSPSAASLIVWMSMFDRESIPIEFLDGTYPDSVKEWVKGNPQIQLLSDQESLIPAPETVQAQNLAEEMSDRLADDVATLKTYDLIHHGTSGSTLNMHRLVQLSAWKWIDNAPGGLEQYRIQYISFMRYLLPITTPYGGPKFRKLLQHMMMLVPIRVTHREASLKRNFVLTSAGVHAHNSGEWQAAEHLLRESLQGWQSTGRHDSRAASVTRLAYSWNLHNQGKGEGTEALLRYQLEWHRKWFDNGGVSTIQCMQLLSAVLHDNGDYNASAQLCKEALKYSEDISQYSDHSGLDAVLTSRGRMLQMLGRYDEAIEIFEQQLAGFKSKPGINPTAWTRMKNLADCYYSNCDFERARELYEAVLAARTDEFGIGHRHTLDSLQFLSYTLYRQGRIDEAEKRCREALRLGQQNLGDDYLTFSMMCHLAQILQVTKRYTDATGLYETGLAGLSRFPSRNLDDENGWREGYAELQRTLSLEAQRKSLTVDALDVQMQDSAVERKGS